MSIFHNPPQKLLASFILFIGLLAYFAAPQSLAAQQTPEQPETEAELVAPANDNFASAQVVTGTIGSVSTFTNTEATGETGEPNHAGNSMPLNSVWFRWTAPASVSMTFGTYGGILDTTIGVYTGTSVNSLVQVGANDNIPNGYVSNATFIANAGTTYYIAIDGAGGNKGSTGGIFWRINRAESGSQFDFDGDFNSDYAVFRPSNSTWIIRNSQMGDTTAMQWGVYNADRLMPGAYDGTRTNIAVWRAGTGVFYKAPGIFGGAQSKQWGMANDEPVQGDFDGDDRADYAIWRRSTGTFYVLRSSNGSLLAQNWGNGNTDVATPGDYDGDGKTDFAVFRWDGPDAGTFFVLRSSNGSFLAQRWGLGPDLVVPGDYDGDGKNDIAVRRGVNNTYYVLRSSDGALYAIQWGTFGDDPAPGDYDGDGRTDIAVYRKSAGTFYVLSSRTGALVVQKWGQADDIAVAFSNVH